MFFTKTRILFILLTLLALGQVLWWAYLLTSQQNIIAELNPSLLEKASQFKRMILFETAFFILFWCTSLWFIYKTFLVHEDLRKAHNLFLGGISHELKTPIANVSLCLETLTRPNLDEPKKKQYIERAQASLSSLLEQVENLLSFTSLSSLPLEKEKINVKSLCQQIVDSYVGQKKISREELSVQIDDNFYVHESPVALNIILKNIIDNSIKYTQGATPRNILISQDQDKNKKIIRIKDNGIGMTNEEILRCSEAFWRSSRVVDKAYPGTGMGLTLLNEITKKRNISFNLHSSGVGQGLEVSLSWENSI